MRRLACALLLLAALPVAAQGFDASDLRTHVDVLADPELAGRLTGSAGERAATAYVAEHFAAAGLEPAGTEDWFHDFTFVTGIEPVAGNRLRVDRGGDVGEPVLGRDWRPLAFAEPGSVASAPVVFAGYGLVSPGEPAFDAYGDLDVEDAWVLVWRGVPAALPLEARARLAAVADLRYKAAAAKARGARGLIVAPEPGAAEPVTERTRGLVRGGSAGIPAIAIESALANALLAALDPVHLAALQAGADRPGGRLPD
ncbi:MAG: PA domain-containing protein, partial [Pseudomonadota bacterium]